MEFEKILNWGGIKYGMRGQERNYLYMRERERKRERERVGIGKIESMETWKNKMRKYQENWNFWKYKIGKY